MERSNFFTDQDVLQEDLNNIETSKGNQLKYRAQYMLGASGGVNQATPARSASIDRGGIYFNMGGYITDPPTYSNYFYPSALSSTSIRILEGAALDAGGEVLINPATIDMTKGSTGTNYDWSTAGLGYPQLWYVKLLYAAASGSFKANDAGTSYPTRYTDDFLIQVDYTAPTAEEILLTSFLSDASGNISGSIVDERAFVRVMTPANAVVLDSSIAPVGSHYTVEDHITSVGTGTPSTVNPHGITGTDLGITDTVEPHRKEAHTPGIIDVTGEYLNSAAFRDSYLGTPTDVGADVEIGWTGANANAYMMVNGTTYKPTLVTFSLVNHPDMTAGGDGTYWIYFDNTSASVYNTRATTVSLDTYKAADKLLLCKISRLNGGSDYSNFVDLRRFYGTSQASIAVDSTEQATLDTLNSVSSLQSNLNRIRYQLGLSLSGVGSAWAGSNPLTAGHTTGLADDYHYHSSFPYILTINDQSIWSNVGYYINQWSGKKAGMMVHTNMSQTVLHLVSDYSGASNPTTAMLATGSMGAISVAGNLIFARHAAGIPTVTNGSASVADAWHTHAHPASGSFVNGYAHNQMKQNPTNSPIYATGWAHDNGTGGNLSLYMGETSASVAAGGDNEVHIQKQTAPSSGNASIFAVIPPGFFYKWYYTPGSLLALRTYDFPSASIDA